MHRGWLRPLNVSPPERVGRGYLGFLSIGIGGKLLSDADSPAFFGAMVLLVLLGVYLAATGMLGRCPVYRRLGHESASLKSYGP